MDNRFRATARRRAQEGYAILLVLFFVAILLISTISVAPNVLTAGRREKEAEMIWRGKQYTRGIKLYYRKTGKFPTSLEDLTKPHVGNIRFMRQAYKDPMNPKDGEWRLIYVGPSGQLIGSLNPQRSLQMNGFGGAPGAVPGTPASQLAVQSSAGFGQVLGQGLNQAAGQVFGNSGASSPSSFGGSSNTAQGTLGQPNAAPGSNAAAAGSTGTGTDTAADPAASDAANQALLESEPTTVMGGNIIGVGSKINQRSITVYEKAKNYKQFEFIWDPSKDVITVGGAAGQPIGTPAGSLGALPGQPNSFGNTPGQNPNAPGSNSAPLNPQPGPPETAPNPPQP
jgi:hypothetical protein